MKTRKALADISVDSQKGWILPTAGTQPFRYWAWANFQKDPTWGKKTWTLWVDLTGEPDLSRGHVEAIVFFVASGAPHEVIEPGADFDLFCGQVHYTDGHIRKILSDNTSI